MTRFLEKEKKYQVNSNLIGVQVRPEEVPPVYRADEITVNYNCYDAGWISSKNGLPLIMGSDGTVYEYSNGIQVIGDDNYYVYWIYGGSDDYEVLVKQDEVVVGANIYKYDVAFIVYGTINIVFNSTGGGLMYMPTKCYNDGDDNIYDFDYETRVVSYNNNYGYLRSLDPITRSYKFNFDSEADGVTYWQCQSWNDCYVVANTSDPEVGSYVESSEGSTPDFFPPSQITAVVREEVEPAHPEEVDCSVSYSVDGETWTDWPDNLTDDNNVIANIPRYMFLKFGQDVEITEE